MTFTLELLEPGGADVYVDGAAPAELIEALDRAGLRAVNGDARAKDSCAAVLDVTSGAVRLGGEVFHEHDADALAGWLVERLQSAPAIPNYAFFVGRLERDFGQARSAIRAAVEEEAGVTCLWADDGRFRTNLDSVRESTRELIRHAAFVIADLTLGPESPHQENPSRAHEIGLAIAYEKPLMLCSQEPRRYPYYSIGDMQMTFWQDEEELAACVRAWIAAHPRLVRRHVLNTALPGSRLATSSFRFDPSKRFIGPGLRRRRRLWPR
jgi:hypothetical protein